MNIFKRTKILIRWFSTAIILLFFILSSLYTRFTLTSIEQNLPIIILAQLEPLNSITENMREAIILSDVIRNNPDLFEDFKIKIDRIYDELVDLRNTYVIDNLIQASVFYDATGSAIVDVRQWLEHGVSGFPPISHVSLNVIHLRLSDSLKKARLIRDESQSYAQTILLNQKERLETFLMGVNILLFLSLFLLGLVILLMFRQRELMKREALAIAEKNRLISIIESTTDLVSMATADKKILYLNSAGKKMLGWEEDENITSKLIDDLHPEKSLNHIIQNGMPNAFENGVWNGETALLNSFGLEIPVSQTIMAHKNIKGEVEYFSTIMRDVSSIKLAEKALKESEFFRKRIFESSPIPIVVMDSINYRFIDCNLAAVNAYRFSSIEETKEKTPLDVSAALQYDGSPSEEKSLFYINKAIDEGSVVFEWKHQRPDGSFWDAEVHLLCFTLNKQKMLQFSLIDITERKKAEETLLKVQKLESLGVLAGGIAHDFNNILSGIYGNIELAFMKELSDSGKEFLKNALSSLDRAKSLTRQLLTFAKGGSPVIQIEKLTPFLDKTVKFALSGSNIAADISIPDTIWNCKIDKNQIGQVIDNIVINAVQAMPDGGRIRVNAENCEIKNNSHSVLKTGNYVKISITDHGIGIPLNIINKIFDPFYSTKSMGHGLGLATSYSIIKRHEGSIEVESEQGKGTTFNIFLPATISDSPEISTAKFKTKQSSGLILIMDDEEIIRVVLKNMLEELGYTVLSTKEGFEAIEVFKKHKKLNKPIDFVILDLTIPNGLGGKQTAEEIRKIDDKVTLILSSGYEGSPVMSNPENYGFKASISKPFTYKEIYQVLSNLSK